MRRGMAMHDPEYLRRAREICDRFDVLLIADEIAVGFGRTGTLFACEQGGITPDLLCLSKGITGGTLPLSVVMASDRVYEAFYDDRLERGFFALALLQRQSACLPPPPFAVLDVLEKEEVLERNAALRRTSTGRAEAIRSRRRWSTCSTE